MRTLTSPPSRPSRRVGLHHLPSSVLRAAIKASQQNGSARVGGERKCRDGQGAHGGGAFSKYSTSALRSMPSTDESSLEASGLRHFPE